MKKKKIYFITWLAEKLFDEKINDRICWTVLALIAGAFIARTAYYLIFKN